MLSSIGNSGINEENIKEISEMFKVNFSVGSLFLYKNNLSDSALKILSEGVAININNAKSKEIEKRPPIEFEPKQMLKLYNYIRGNGAPIYHELESKDIAEYEATILADQIRANDNVSSLDGSIIKRGE